MAHGYSVPEAVFFPPCYQVPLVSVTLLNGK
jgi:hypothetical protein